MPNKRVIEEKQAVIEEIRTKLSGCQVAVLTNYRGLNVAQMTKLRRTLRDGGVEYAVIKNTMLRLAARKAGIDGLDRFLEGPTAVAFGYKDVVTPAKLLLAFARENKQLEIKGGILEGKVIGPEYVRVLSELPPREVLLARVAGGLQSPLAGFAGALQALLRGFAYGLDALKKQREAGANA